jgi:hypothetical protein
MSEDHFRWLLMWHGAFVRDVTAIEVGRDGLERAKQRTRLMDRRRKAFLKRVGMPLLPLGSRPNSRPARR